MKIERHCKLYPNCTEKFPLQTQQLCEDKFSPIFRGSDFDSKFGSACSKSAENKAHGNKLLHKYSHHQKYEHELHQAQDDLKPIEQSENRNFQNSTKDHLTPEFLSRRQCLATTPEKAQTLAVEIDCRVLGGRSKLEKVSQTTVEMRKQEYVSDGYPQKISSPLSIEHTGANLSRSKVQEVDELHSDSETELLTDALSEYKIDSSRFE